MYYELLNIGDRVLAITNDFLSIERADGSVELYPLVIKKNKISIDTDAVTTIGYSSESISCDTEEYITDSGVHVVKF